MKKIEVLALLISLPLCLFGQQLPYQTQFRQLHAFINPAAINSDFFLYEYNASVNASYRMQWAAQPQTPRTFHLSGEYIHQSADSRSGGFNLAMGGLLLQDRVGPLSVTSGQARIASFFAKDPYMGAFSIGANFGFTQYRILHDRIVWETLNDDLIPLDNVKTTKPELGLGAYYYKRIKYGRLKGDNFYGGVSIPQLFAAHTDVESFDSIGTKNKVPITRVPHFYLTGGWYHFFNEDSFLEIGIWGKYVNGSKPNLHLICRFQPIQTFWLGGGFNPNGLVHLESGFNLPGFLSSKGRLKVGYAFDYNITAFDLPLGASHEIHLSYLLDTN